MKTFRFSLATVLKLKQLREETMRMALLRVRAGQAAAEQEERRLAKLSRSMASEFAEYPHPISGAELRFAADCRVLISQAQLLAAESERKIRQQRDAQQEAYASAHRESEMLELLRERQLQSFQLEERRTEQRDMDEIHTIRRTGARIQSQQSSIINF